MQIAEQIGIISAKLERLILDRRGNARRGIHRAVFQPFDESCDFFIAEFARARHGLLHDQAGDVDIFDPAELGTIGQNLVDRVLEQNLDPLAVFDADNITF